MHATPKQILANRRVTQHAQTVVRAILASKLYHVDGHAQMAESSRLYAIKHARLAVQWSRDLTPGVNS